MTWEQMYQAIKALAPGAAVRMRKPGDWYVDADMMIGRRAEVRCRSRQCDSPQAAIEDHWAKMIAVEAPQYIYTGSGGTKRRVVWNGFMWQDVQVKSGTTR